MIRHISVSLALALLSSAAAAQAPQPVEIARLVAPVQLDGRVDDAAWQGVKPLPMELHQPTFRGTPTERTEVRVAHDDAFLYVAGRMYDSEPDKIQAASLRRDNMALTNDWLCVNLDTFRDRENLLTFCTTPAGVRTDFAIFNDAQGSFPANVSWNTFWDVEVTRDSAGWSAEYRIPLSSLRFQSQDDRVRMGMIAWRYIARKQEMTTFPAVEPKWGFWSVFKPSQAQEVVLQGVRGRKPLYVTPYMLGGYGRNARLNGPKTAYLQEGDPTREVGLDVKYGVTSNLTLDLTVNTDFAQVEADDQQVNLTRFSLFYPEKRQFFQERSNVLGFNMGGPNRLFYSRRIGLADGRPVPILGGARMIGRVGAWDVGLLDMQTASHDGSISENMGVLRLRRQVLNPYSNAGAIVTSRIGTDGRYNVAVGADANLRLFGDDYLQFAYAQTADDRVSGRGLDAARVHTFWERRTEKGIGYTASFSRSGADYTPGLGFEARHDYSRYALGLSHGWIPGRTSRVLRHKLSLDGSSFFGNSDGALESADAALRWGLDTKKGHGVQLAAIAARENLDVPFQLATGVRVPTGSYRFQTLSAAYSMPNGRLRRADVAVEGGTFFDGWRGTAQMQPSWTVSEHLTLGGTYQFNRVRFPERGQGFDAHVGRLRAEAMVNTRLSAAGFLQYNSAADVVGVNLRMRYNPREGNDIYVVYNEGVNTDLLRVSPALPRSGSRALLIKYSRTFAPGF